MASIKKIKPGQILYDKHRYKQGNTTISAWGVWPVKVISVDLQSNTILASWNGNKPHTMSLRQIKRLKVNKPKEN